MLRTRPEWHKGTTRGYVVDKQKEQKSKDRRLMLRLHHPYSHSRPLPASGEMSYSRAGFTMGSCHLHYHSDTYYLAELLFPE